jgi:hypothetical protein
MPASVVRGRYCMRRQRTDCLPRTISQLLHSNLGAKFYLVGRSKPQNMSLLVPIPTRSRRCMVVASHGPRNSQLSCLGRLRLRCDPATQDQLKPLASLLYELHTSRVGEPAEKFPRSKRIRLAFKIAECGLFLCDSSWLADLKSENIKRSGKDQDHLRHLHNYRHTPANDEICPLISVKASCNSRL